MSLFDLGNDENYDVRRKLLESFPVVSDDARSDTDDGEAATVFVKIKSGTGFLDRFRPPVIEKKYELDEFGTFVYRQIDAKRSIRDIVGMFKERFGLSRRESELGVVAFMKLLNHRKIIHVVEEHIETT